MLCLHLLLPSFKQTEDIGELKAGIEEKPQRSEIGGSLSTYSDTGVFEHECIELSHSPPEQISPSHEEALKDELSPVSQREPLCPTKSKITVGVSPSDFISEESENVTESQEDLNKVLYDVTPSEAQGSTKKTKFVDDDNTDGKKPVIDDDNADGKKPDIGLSEYSQDAIPKDDYFEGESSSDENEDYGSEVVESKVHREETLTQEDDFSAMKVDVSETLDTSDECDTKIVAHCKPESYAREEIMSFDNIAFEGSNVIDEVIPQTSEIKSEVNEDKYSPDYENIDVVRAFEVQTNLREISEEEEEEETVDVHMDETTQIGSEADKDEETMLLKEHKGMSISSESSSGKFGDPDITMDELQEKLKPTQQYSDVFEIEPEEFQHAEESDDEEFKREDPFLVEKHTSDQESEVSLMVESERQDQVAMEKIIDLSDHEYEGESEETKLDNDENQIESSIDIPEDAIIESECPNQINLFDETCDGTVEDNSYSRQESKHIFERDDTLTEETVSHYSKLDELKSEVLTDEDSGTIERMDSEDRPDFLGLGGDETPVQEQLSIDIKEPHEEIQAKHAAAVIDSIMERCHDSIFVPNEPEFPDDVGPSGFEYRSSKGSASDEEKIENSPSTDVISDRKYTENDDIRKENNDVLQVTSDRIALMNVHHQSLGSIDRTESGSVDSEDFEEPYGDQKEEMHLEMLKDIAPSPQPPVLHDDEDEDLFLDDNNKNLGNENVTCDSEIDKIDIKESDSTKTVDQKCKTSMTSSSSDTSLEPTLLAATYDLETGAVSRVVATYDMSPDAVEKTLPVETKPRAILSSPEDEVFDDEQKVKSVALDEDDSEEKHLSEKFGILEIADTSSDKIEDDGTSSPFEIVDDTDLLGYEDYKQTNNGCADFGTVSLLEDQKNNSVQQDEESVSLSSPVSSSEPSDHKSLTSDVQDIPISEGFGEIVENNVVTGDLLDLSGSQGEKDNYIQSNGPTEVCFQPVYDDPFQPQLLEAAVHDNNRDVVAHVDSTSMAEEQSTTIDESIPVDSHPAPEIEPETEDHGRQDAIQLPTLVTESEDDKFRASEQTLYDLEMPSEEIQPQQEKKTYEQDESFNTQVEIDQQDDAISPVKTVLSDQDTASNFLEYELMEGVEREDEILFDDDLNKEEEEPELVALVEPTDDDQMEESVHSDEQSVDDGRPMSPIEDRFQFKVDELDVDRPKSPEPEQEKEVLAHERLSAAEEEEKIFKNSTFEDDLEVKASEFVSNVLEEAKYSIKIEMNKSETPEEMDQNVIEQVQRKLSQSSGLEEYEVHREVEMKSESSESEKEEDILIENTQYNTVAEDIPEIMVTEHLHTETQQEDYPVSYAQIQYEIPTKVEDDVLRTEIAMCVDTETLMDVTVEDKTQLDKDLDSDDVGVLDYSTMQESTTEQIMETEDPTTETFDNTEMEKMETKPEGPIQQHSFLDEGSDAQIEQKSKYEQAINIDEFGANDEPEMAEIFNTDQNKKEFEGKCLSDKEMETHDAEDHIVSTETMDFVTIDSEGETGDSSSVDSFATVVPVNQEEDELILPEDRLAELASMSSSFCSESHDEQPVDAVISMDVREQDHVSENEDLDTSEANTQRHTYDTRAIKSTSPGFQVAEQFALIHEEDEIDDDEPTVEIPVYREHMELSVIQEESDEEKRKSTSTSSSERLDAASSSSSEKLITSPDIPPSPGIIKEKFFNKSAERDDVSISSSLLEFERLESEVVQSSLDSIPSGKESKSGKGGLGDGSVSSSLAEFELMERVVTQSVSLEQVASVREPTGSGDSGSLSSLAEFEKLEKELKSDSDSLEKLDRPSSDEEKIGSVSENELDRKSFSSSNSSLDEFERLEQEVIIDEELEAEAQKVVKALESGSLMHAGSDNMLQNTLGSRSEIDEISLSKEQIEFDMPREESVSSLSDKVKDDIERDSLSGGTEEEECPLEIERIIKQASKNVENFGKETDTAAHITGTMSAVRHLLEEHQKDQPDTETCEPLDTAETIVSPKKEEETGATSSGVHTEILIPAEISTTELDEDSLKDEDSITHSAHVDSDSIQDPDSVMQISAESIDDHATTDLSYEAMPDLMQQSADADSLSAGAVIEDAVMQTSADSLGSGIPDLMQQSVDSLAEDTQEGTVTADTESEYQQNITSPLSADVPEELLIASTDSLEPEMTDVKQDVMQESTDSLEQKAPSEDHMIKSVDSLEGNIMPTSESKDSLEKETLTEENNSESSEIVSSFVNKKTLNVMATSLESGAWSQSSSVISSETLKSSDMDSGQDHEMMELSVDSPQSMGSPDDCASQKVSRKFETVESFDAKKPKLDYVEQTESHVWESQPVSKVLDIEGNIQPDKVNPVDEEGNVQTKDNAASNTETYKTETTTFSQSKKMSTHSTTSYSHASYGGSRSDSPSSNNDDDRRYRKGMTYEPGVGKISYTVDSATGRGWSSRDTVTNITIEPEVSGGSYHSRASTPTDSSHSDNCYCGPDSSSASYGKDDTPLSSPMHRGITVISISQSVCFVWCAFLQKKCY